MSEKVNTSIKILLLLVLLYCPFFLHLGNLPIRLWDESRLVSNAISMQSDGDLIVTHYKGHPDMWNTKPPLMIWSQVLFLNILGNQELSFRMPSAIAGVLTCLFLMFVSLKFLKSYWFGMIAILILVTSQGYLGEHVARTGDYDAMLTLFTTLSSLSLFLWSNNKKSIYLHLFFAGLMLGVLTKSIQALMFLPGIAIYLFITKKFLDLFKNKWLYIDLLLFIVIVGGYYALRETMNAGYIKAVFENELGGRYLNTIENHKHEFSYYFDNLYNVQFTYWVIFFFIGIFIAFITKDDKLRKITLFGSLLSISYLLLISMSGTKLLWYTAPAFPFLAITSAVSIYKLYTLIAEIQSTELSKKMAGILATGMLLMFFFYPYYAIIDKVYKPKEIEGTQDFYLISHYLKDAVDGKHDLNNVKIYYQGYSAYLDYYIDKLYNEGDKISFIGDTQAERGDVILIHNEQNYLDTLKKQYTVEMLDKYDNLRLIRLQ